MGWCRELVRSGGRVHEDGDMLSFRIQMQLYPTHVPSTYYGITPVISNNNVLHIQMQSLNSSIYTRKLISTTQEQKERKTRTF